MTKETETLKKISDRIEDLSNDNSLMEIAMGDLGWIKNTGKKIPKGEIEVIGQGTYYEGDCKIGYIEGVTSYGDGKFLSRFDDLYIKFWRKK